MYKTKQQQLKWRLQLLMLILLMLMLILLMLVLLLLNQVIGPTNFQVFCVFPSLKQQITYWQSWFTQIIQYVIWRKIAFQGTKKTTWNYLLLKKKVLLFHCLKLISENECHFDVSVWKNRFISCNFSHSLTNKLYA